MSYLKFGLDHLQARRIRLTQLSVATLLASPAFLAQAELYFNPRFLATTRLPLRIFLALRRGRSYRRAPIVWISI